MFTKIEMPGSHGISGTVNAVVIFTVGWRDINVSVMITSAPVMASNVHAHHFISYSSSINPTTTSENRMQKNAAKDKNVQQQQQQKNEYNMVSE